MRDRMPSRIIAASALCLFLCVPIQAEKEKVGRALVTFYWLIDEHSSKYRGNATAVLRDPAGRVLARTHPRFKLDLVRQGSGRLRDGRTVIFIKRVAGESRFRISRSTYGLGSTGCRLVPYRTIAVDPRFVKPRTRIYIPQLKGTRLPDGTVHDGMFIASDRGHFRGAHVDLFVGEGARGARPFIQKGYGSRSHVTIYAAGKTTGCRP
jgi:3D (Asp-Asp-Asp) domain-containing protein